MQFSKGDLATCGADPTGSPEEGKMKDEGPKGQNDPRAAPKKAKWKRWRPKRPKWKGMKAQEAKMKKMKVQKAKLKGNESPKSQNEKRTQNSKGGPLQKSTVRSKVKCNIPKRGPLKQNGSGYGVYLLLRKGSGSCHRAIALRWSRRLYPPYTQFNDGAKAQPWAWRLARWCVSSPLARRF